MALAEAETGVEPVRVKPGGIRHQLHQTCAMRPALFDGVADHRLSDPVPAHVAAGMDRLDGQVGRASAGERRDQRGLEGADHLARHDGDEKTVVRTCSYAVKCGEILRQIGRVGAVAVAAKPILREHRGNRRHVAAFGHPDDDAAGHGLTHPPEKGSPPSTAR